MLIILTALYISNVSIPINGIDNPLPSIEKHGEVNFNLRVEPDDWIKFSLGIGLWDYFSMKAGYGGKNIVGYGDIDWSNEVWVELRGMVYNDGSNSFLIGYSTIPYLDSIPKGLFGVLGRRQGIGPFAISLNGGLNYNFERKLLDGFADLYLNIGKPHYIIFEWTLNSGSENQNIFSPGYQNQALPLGIQVDLKDIFSDNIGRGIQIFYRESF
jgi:hypothetical protein